MLRNTLPLFSILMLMACGPAEPPEPEQPTVPAPEVAASRDAAAARQDSTDRLGVVLESQSEAVRARYDQRHPRETLDFFGIEPGMTVVEALPGGGWYSRILLPYLGAEGHLIAANYALEMWPLFPFGTEEFMAEMRQWPETFPAQAAEWCTSDCAGVSTFWLGSLPEDLRGTADAVMFVRALHNLARFNEQHGYLDEALADAFAVLRPGGTFGVVQHWARDDMPEAWANGDNGYLKRDFVVEQVEAAGFEWVDESDVNVNPNDRPGTDEYVWRLPPSLRVPPEADNPEALKARYEAIGESHRMTLKFRKPDDEVSGEAAPAG